jgi:hypothetical protein
MWNFLEDNCPTPEEAFIVVELLGQKLKETFDIDWHIATEKQSEEIDRWTSSQSEEKPISS